MINWVLSILAIKEIITVKEAEELSSRLDTMTHPQKFMDAHRIIENLMKEIQNK